MLTTFQGDAGNYNDLSPVGILPIHGQCRVNTLHGMLVPNVHDWRAGDVVVSTSAPDPGSLAIVAYQAVLYLDRHVHAWTHVGMYDGQGYIWDANPTSNVQVRSVSDYMLSKTSVGLLRLKGVQLNEVELRSIIERLKRLRYDMMSAYALPLLHRVLAGLGQSRPAEPAPENVICSTFVERALRYAGHQPFKALPVTVPADYAASPAFEFVPLKWHRLV